VLKKLTLQLLYYLEMYHISTKASLTCLNLATAGGAGAGNVCGTILLYITTKTYFSASKIHKLKRMLTANVNSEHSTCHNSGN